MGTESTYRQELQKIRVGALARHDLLWRLGLFALFALLLVTYAIVVTTTATRGNDITLLQRQKQDLLIEAKRVEATIAGEQSIDRLKERMTSMQLVSAGEAEYVDLTHGAVARR